MFLAIRVKLGLIALAAVFLAAFAWSGAEGQLRPPRQPMNPPGFNPGMRPPGGIGGMNPPGGMSIVWRCSKCGHQGQGAVPPKTCPQCGVTFINGIGNGSSGGLRGNPPAGLPRNPGFNPPATNPPGFGPNVPPVGQPPAFNPPPPADFSVPPVDPSESPKRKAVLILVVVGVVVVGASLLAAGGIFLLVYMIRNSNSSS